MNTRLPSKKLEQTLLKSGFKNIIAVDEVGVGSLAGPVLACAIMLDKNFFKQNPALKKVRDSKLMTKKQREDVFQQLNSDKNLRYAVSYSLPKTIDRYNIYNASRLAMKRSVRKIIPRAAPKSSSCLRSKGKFKKPKILLLVDGPKELNGLPLPQKAIIKGDRKIISIAIASIMAKVLRDKMMERYSKRYPGYGFEKHKGYGTKLHIARLSSLRPSKIHRKSFAPVAKLI